MRRRRRREGEKGEKRGGKEQEKREGVSRPRSLKSPKVKIIFARGAKGPERSRVEK